MLGEAAVDRYLKDVGDYLRVDRERRRDVLDEIAGHLRDAVDAHISHGIEPSQARQRAIAELGPASEVAARFGPEPQPVRVFCGWRRWAPAAVPALNVVLYAFAVIWTVVAVAGGGITPGETMLLQIYTRRSVIPVGLVVVAFIAVRRADRDPRWRTVGWVCTGLAVAFQLLPLVRVLQMS